MADIIALLFLIPIIGLVWATFVFGILTVYRIIREG